MALDGEGSTSHLPQPSPSNVSLNNAEQRRKKAGTKTPFYALGDYLNIHILFTIKISAF
jgi:hypothetical protein